MADREGAERVLDQRESDILAYIQQAILNGSRCFETNDVAIFEVFPPVAHAQYSFREPSLFTNIRSHKRFCDITKCI